MPIEEKKVTCPFNKAHSILAHRMPEHLIKCARAHPLSEMKLCPFNSIHVVPAPELEYHMKNCPNRKKVEEYVYGVKTNTDTHEVPVSDFTLPESSENWDNGEEVSYLDIKDQNLEQRMVLRQVNGLSKAEKKIFHREERQRIQELYEKSQLNTTTTTTTSITSLPELVQETNYFTTEGTSFSVEDNFDVIGEKIKHVHETESTDSSVEEIDKKMQGVKLDKEIEQSERRPGPVNDGFQIVTRKGRGRGRDRGNKQ